MWSFGLTGHAIHNFEKMPASVFDRETQLNGLWIRVLDIEEFERTDKISFRPGVHSQNDVTYFGAEIAQISDSGILLIFAIGLILVWVSRFGEKFFKNKKR